MKITIIAPVRQPRGEPGWGLKLSPLNGHGPCPDYESPVQIGEVKTPGAQETNATIDSDESRVNRLWRVSFSFP